MQLIVNDLAINYVKSGKGKALILLHGWADSLNGLNEINKGLSKDFEVMAIDLPGFGASQTPKDAWGVGDFAEFLAEFIKKAGLKDVYGLIGHSNGGAIAIKAIADGLVNSEKLVLLASSGIRGERQGRLGAVKLATKTAKIISSPLPASTKKRLKKKLYDSLGSDLLAAENMSASFKKVVSEDMRSDAQKLDLPTLIIYGEEDNIAPVRYGQLYHQLIKDSTLEVISGTGHFLNQEKPELVVKLIRDFL